MIVIEVLNGPEDGKIFKIDKHEAFIGRKREVNDVVFEYDKLMSRKHARIFVERGNIFVEDMGSTRGTFVGPNKNPIPGEKMIEPGDEIKAGMVLFRIVSIS